MRWQRGRRSDNVVDARGRTGRRVGGGLSLGGVALVVIVSLMMGQGPAADSRPDRRPGHPVPGRPVRRRTGRQ
ncbi:hypothetical protein SAMN05216213_102226 [Ectopseudomonas guguanensis]|uniref:Uncharacterized protein n=1 Tax=Ectopseudomonas guguanensis TaxID=1198456 RepID=A0A1H0N1I6_9GAMM|nr:hypothetical protein SAMN05216213_102226 [Pseudomonas guguanensis]